MGTTVLGIDPGKNGGVAVTEAGLLVDALPYTGGNLCQLLEIHAPALAVIEKVHAMPAQGVSSMFSFGMVYGEALGILLAYGYSEAAGNLLLVPPQRWKRAYGLIGGDKAASVAKAKDLFRGAEFLPSKRSRKPADGMAEAALISLYGFRSQKEGESDG